MKGMINVTLLLPLFRHGTDRERTMAGLLGSLCFEFVYTSSFEEIYDSMRNVKS